MLFDNSTEPTIMCLSPTCIWNPSLSFASGDEILSVNGHSTSGLSHSEAIAIFKGIRTGRVIVHVARRDGGGSGGAAAAASSSSSNISR